MEIIYHQLSIEERSIIERQQVMSIKLPAIVKWWTVRHCRSLAK